MKGEVRWHSEPLSLKKAGAVIISPLPGTEKVIRPVLVKGKGRFVVELREI